MDKKMWVVVGIAAVLIVAAFFGGAAASRFIPGLSGSSRTSDNGMRRFGQNGANGQRSGTGGGAVNGKVIKSSADAITVQTRDGSSRIVNLSSSTKFSKTESATAGDVSVGTTVTAFGTSGNGNTVDAVQVMIGAAGFGGFGMRPPDVTNGNSTGQSGQSGQQGGMGGPPPGF